MTLLRLRGIAKSFGAARALRTVDLDVERGEVHALLGENGAGKSTLANVVGGLVRPDAGSIEVDGRRVAPRSPRAARALGIGLVHQHDALIDALTVAENFELLAASGASWLAPARLARRAADGAARHGIDLPRPGARVADLTIGERQRLEIARVLAVEPRILVLDEPTAVLAPGEAEALLAAARSIAASGVGVLLVSHFLGEVERVADRVTVLRRGEVAGSFPGGVLDRRAVTEAMVGEHLSPAPRVEREPGAPRLRVRRLESTGAGERLAGVSFEVRAGEVVGVAGVAGNGQRALAAAIAGTLAASGEVEIDGVDVSTSAVAERRAHGLAIVPEDRRREGLALELPIAENLLLSSRALAEAGLSFALPRGEVAARAQDLVARFDVRGALASQPASALSGGNQQRVVLARELSSLPAVALLQQPSRGLDVKAAAFVAARIDELRAAGAAVLLISTDLDEVLARSDRVLVMLRGEVVREFPRGASALEVGAAMVGGGP